MKHLRPLAPRQIGITLRLDFSLVAGSSQLIAKALAASYTLQATGYL